MLVVGRFIIPPHSIGTAAYLPAGVLVYGLCLYAVSVRCATWLVVTAGLVTAVGAIVINAPTSAAAIVLTAILLLFGVFVRSRRTQAGASWPSWPKQHEGERALLEERQRIARELHDVVAHHMSVIAIQAEAAPLQDRRPAEGAGRELRRDPRQRPERPERAAPRPGRAAQRDTGHGAAARPGRPARPARIGAQRRRDGHLSTSAGRPGRYRRGWTCPPTGSCRRR